MAPTPSKPVEEPDDRLLAFRARSGDRRAFAELVMRYSDRLTAMLHHLCGGDPDLAAELTQEAFVRAFSRLEQFKGESSFYTWLWRLARNRALDLLARKRPLTGSQAMGDPEAPSPGPAERVGNAELVDRVRAALATLPPDARELLLLREYEGWDYDRIAQALEVPIGTVKSRLSRARMSLRVALTGHIAAEDL
jgi:RNA polymerase sigma-70 factor (ECF subfamily)